MAARALTAAVAGAGHRVAGRTGPPPLLLASCRSGGENRYSTSAQPEEEEERKDVGGGAAMTGAQVEAALNRKNVEVLQGEDGAAGEDGSWVPDQETGVFVPADTDTASHGGGAPPAPPGAGPSVLDQTLFVREEDMEDVERPAMANADGGKSKN